MFNTTLLHILRGVHGLALMDVVHKDIKPANVGVDHHQRADGRRELTCKVRAWADQSAT